MSELIEILVQYCKEQSSKEGDEIIAFTDICANPLIRVGCVFYVITIAMFIFTLFIDNDIWTYIWTTSFLIATTFFLGFLIWRWKEKVEEQEKIIYGAKQKLSQIKKQLDSVKLPEWLSINNFRLDNKDKYRYLIKIHHQETRSKKYVVGYSIPDDDLYLIMKNFEGIIISEILKNKYLIDFENNLLPSFKKDYNNVDGVRKFLNELYLNNKI